jgi:virginiamycin B lyase
MRPTTGADIRRLATVLGSVALVVCWHGMAAAVEAVSCPAGEMTLATDSLRLQRSGPGRDRLRDRRGDIALPKGVSLDLTAEAVTIAVELDHVPLLDLTLPPGTLVPSGAGNAVTFRPRPRIGRSLRFRRQDDAIRLSLVLTRLDLAGLEPAAPPSFAKLLVKVGDDCFSAVLACARRGRTLDCRPERSAMLHGRVLSGRRVPLPGAMVTAYDDGRLESVSVFAQPDGRYAFPPLRPGSWRVRARLVGYTEETRNGVVLAPNASSAEDFTLTPTDDYAIRLPATDFLALLLDRWPDPTIRGDFTLSCGNCHQIGGWRFRRDKTVAEWTSVVTRMMTFLPPYFQTTRDLLLQNLLDTLGPGATIPPIPPPPAPTGEVLRAVIYEYGLGDATARPGCHDLELGTDGVIYADAGVRWIDPRSGERGLWPLLGGAHSIERAPNGDMWITQASEDALAHLDVRTHAFTYYPLPKIGDDQGSYPHTLRFDDAGRIWFTLTKSNHVGLFDPASSTFAYYRLPEADAAEVGLSIPVAYGCDTAPDGGVWWSQLFGRRIGRLDPVTGTMRVWKPPFFGPRRLHADADGIVWVPGYASGVLGRFDPATERWKVYDLPTGRHGPPGFGTSETPYALNTNRRTDEVWVTGSNSDTLLRFDPARERFTAFPLPTQGSFTREIEFDPDNNVWTCTSNEPAGPDEPGRGKFVKVELPPPDARCGNGRLEATEECDDGNDVDCDGCSTRCTLVTGCGDGVRCGAEACDDGNLDDCDGCSGSCLPEPGLRCGDGIVNETCGEVCDPPVPGRCSDTCLPVAACGNGLLDPGEACDDGNTDDCDGCSGECTLEGCGDGHVCPGETCDDGNDISCDGCSPACEIEVGARCGDGIVNPACGEDCDPPSDVEPRCTFACRLGAAAALGTRHLSVAGASYSSALGTGTPLGTIGGDLDLVAGAPAADGVAAVTVSGPVYLRAPLLGGAFGNLCVRIAACTGIVDCVGTRPVGVEVVQDSAGPGTQGNPPVTTTGLGPAGGPGSVLLDCDQSIVQTGPTTTDCASVLYPPARSTVYTTGHTEAFYVNGDPHIGPGRIAIDGAPFACGTWTVENGPGALAGAFLIENDPQAGDTANVNVLDD